jgi:hypothetical protein
MTMAAADGAQMEPTTMPRSEIVEISPFTLADHVSSETLLAASRRMETQVLSAMPGYVGRVLMQTNERTWTDMVFWRSKEAAEEMIEIAAANEVCRGYFACMADADPERPADGVTHYRIVQGYGGIDV